MEIQLWRSILCPYELAVRELIVKFEHIISEHRENDLYSPIEQVSGRVKSVSSILEKMQRKHIPIEQMETEVEDLAGVRIICQFEEDIDTVAAIIRRRTDMEVKSEKNYLTHIKQSGYRSYHMILYYIVETIDGPKRLQVEVQIRTMAMNFWATIEHSLQYKYKGDMPPHVAERLARECPGAAVMQDDVMRYFDSMLETDFAHTDAFIAITSNDEYNLVASMYAESQGISKVVTRINAKSRLKVLPKTSKICTISRNDVAADRIFAYSRSLMNASGDDKVESLYRLMDGKIEFIELNIDDKDKNLNIPLKNLKLKRNVLVAFIIRDTQTIIPRGDDEIHDGDTVLIGSINHHIAELKDIFAD